MEEFKLALKVREYECDIQGRVNNAVYFNYLEHTRYEFMLSKGIDVTQMTQSHQHIVIVRNEVDYISSLFPGDEFDVIITPKRLSKLKFLFEQRIVKCQGAQLVLKAVTVATTLNEKQRPFVPAQIDAIFPMDTP